MVGISVSQSEARQTSGLRLVNLRTDLAPLADLIELVFQDSMDDNGRAAINEMRYMSKLGVALSVLGRLNDWALGIGQGYVWIEDNRLVGNVSIYPASWPPDMGAAWMIANVAVHPDYRRRHIARRLMEASLALIGRKGGHQAILQVDHDNTAAIQLYENLGFVRERVFTTWWRSAMAQAPSAAAADGIHITHPRRSDWRAEYELAQTLRPNQRGGIGWLQPVHRRIYRPSVWKLLSQTLAMSGTERLIIRSDRDKREIAGTLWIERGVTLTRTRLTLMVRPEYHTPYAQALLGNALRRYRANAFVIEHPRDDTATSALLEDYRFRPNRTVCHMRWSPGR